MSRSLRLSSLPSRWERAHRVTHPQRVSGTVRLFSQRKIARRRFPFFFLGHGRARVVRLIIFITIYRSKSVFPHSLRRRRRGSRGPVRRAKFFGRAHRRGTNLLRLPLHPLSPSAADVQFQIPAVLLHKTYPAPLDGSGPSIVPPRCRALSI